MLTVGYRITSHLHLLHDALSAAEGRFPPAVKLSPQKFTEDFAFQLHTVRPPGLDPWQFDWRWQDSLVNDCIDTTCRLCYCQSNGGLHAWKRDCALANAHGWKENRPGANHPYILKKAEHRTVPVRDKLQNKFEAQGILKQLDIRVAEWPEKLK